MSDIIPYDEPNEDFEINKDFEIARENIYGIIKNGQEAIEQMIKIADQSQNPAAYDTLNQMLKNQAQISKVLLDAHKKKHESNYIRKHKANENKNPPQQITADRVVNQNLIVGSTEDILKMLEKNKENDVS